MNYENIEQERIKSYALGWNDAMAGRAPSSQHTSYALGYLDAKR